MVRLFDGLIVGWLGLKIESGSSWRWGLPFLFCFFEPPRAPKDDFLLNHIRDDDGGGRNAMHRVYENLRRGDIGQIHGFA
jgi:hypothetical protein